MSSFSAEAIQRLEEVLRKDPKSQAFATLAEAYRTLHRLPEAEKTAQQGLLNHPELASGWVAFGKIRRDQKKTEEAFESFQKAVQFSPENLLALQMAGECALELKRPKDALRFFKRLLFLNPQAEKAKKVISRLESVTADEYGEELFAMTKLESLRSNPPPQQAPPPSAATAAAIPSPRAPLSPQDTSKGLLRFLSLVDAFIVRHDLPRATQLLEEARQEYGDHSEIDQRWQMLQRRRSSQMNFGTERAEPLQPLASREEQIRDRKVAFLKAALRRIEERSEALR